MSKKIIPVFIILSIITYFLFPENILKEKEEINVMNEQKIFKTLEVAMESSEFIPEYKEMYKEIEFNEEENFIEHINNLLKLNYTPIEINEIYTFLNDKNREKLLSSEKIELKNYYTITNFEVDKIPRYEQYQELHNTSLEEAVLKVNIGLDHDFYSQIEEITEVNSYTVLVNKYHSLGNYIPEDLVSLSYDNKYQLREKAAYAFEKMISEALTENIYIRPYSAYRSYTYQSSIYNTYVNRDGKDKADTYSARPGHSEHQTGLAVDVWTTGFSYLKENDAEWLKQNSYKYGFIIRYPKEKKDITGYIEEPWHLRYLGVDIATDIVEKNLTFDEYYDLYLK